MRFVWLLCAAACWCSALVTANLELDVTGDERRVVDLGVFGYSAGGYFSLRVTHFFVDDPESTVVNKDGHMHNESIGFVLDMVDSAQSARYARTYARTDDKERRVCYIDDPDLVPAVGKTGRHVYPLDAKHLTKLAEEDFQTTIVVPGLYALFFYNCKGYSDKGPLKPIAVSFSAVAVQYNVVAGGAKNYLSVGDQPLPWVFTFFTMVFCGLTFLWWREMKQNPQYVHRIHKIMLILVVIKTLSLFFEALKYSHFASTGHASVWDFFYYVFLTAKDITLFTVVVLLGSGWSFLKAMLSEQDKKLLVFILPAQVVINIGLAVIEETNEGTSGWGSWSDLCCLGLRIVDVNCCSVVLLPIVRSIKRLQAASAADEADATSASRLRLFRTFYVVLGIFVYFTRIIIVLIATELPYTLSFIVPLVAEAAASCFYVYSGYKFRPMPENPYVHLNKGPDVEYDSTGLENGHDVDTASTTKEAVPHTPVTAA